MSALAGARAYVVPLLLAPALLAGSAATSAPPRRCSAPLRGQTLEHIARIERGLRSAVLIRGRTPDAMTLDARMRYHRVPGVSIAIIDSFRVVAACGYGVRALDGDTSQSRAQVTPTTIFQAASISKSVAALGTLVLVQSGRLTLDEDVNHWLTTWKIPENEFTRRQPVTLRTLLSHGAGITVHGFEGYAAGAPVPTLVQVLDGLPPANSAPIRVDQTPGESWRYSGGGYTVLQQMLIDVSGRSFPALMHDTILRPLGMTHSAYEQPLTPRDTADAASGYRSDGRLVPGRYHTYPELAAAGLSTTPADLARFVIAIEQAARGARHAVLSPALVHQMLTPQTGDYGLGVALDTSGGALRFSHGGANEGFRAFYVGFPATGQGAVIMTNSDAGDALYSEIVRAIAAEYRWPALQPVEREETPAEESELRAIPGRYLIAAGSDSVPLDIVARGDTLVAQLSAWSHDRVLHRAAAWSYFFVEEPLDMSFEPDSAGRVTGVTLNASSQVLHASRVPHPLR